MDVILGGQELRRRRAVRVPLMSHGAAGREHPGEGSPYVELDREAWAALALETEQPLSADEVDRVRGLGDELDGEEGHELYLPLSRVLSLSVEAAGDLHRATESFL